jgi:integrase
MGHVSRTPAGKFRANWRDPAGAQKAKTFATKREAVAFLAQTETAKHSGTYVSPHAGRVLFGEHAGEWMTARRTADTTTARDRSVMRTHVLPQWGAWPLSRVDEMAVQKWITDLAGRRSHAVVAKSLQLTSGVLRSAVRNRLIAMNPCDGVRVPAARKRDTDDLIISRADLRDVLLPVVPARHRALVATAAGAGLRWGEAVGLCRDAVDLDRARLSVLRTVIEVDGNTSMKPFPKSSAGRRTIPLPAWVVTLLREHLDTYPLGAAGLVFANEVGGALRRGLFRTRIWRPALVRSGMLGTVTAEGDKFAGCWTDEDGMPGHELFATEPAAVKHVAKHQAGGLRFHDLRHSYATWLVDDGVPPTMVMRVMGHEKVTTTLELYARRTDDADRILRALTDADPDDGPEDGAAGVPARVR